MFKAAIKTATTATANTNIPFAVAINTNNNTSYNAVNNSVRISRTGYYDVDLTLVGTGFAAGDISAQIFADGEAIAEAIATATVSATTDVITLNISDLVKVISAAAFSHADLSVRLSAAGTINSAILTVTKIR